MSWANFILYHPHYGSGCYTRNDSALFRVVRKTFLVGMIIILLYYTYVPSENIILIHTPNAEMANISSKLHAAITSVMIPFSSPRPFCLYSNSAGRITAELTGLRMHLREAKNIFYWSTRHDAMDCLVYIYTWWCLVYIGTETIIF